MSTRLVILLAFLSALWIAGLLGQFHSAEAVMRYLALSLAVVAVGVWRWKPKLAPRRRFRDRRRPPEE